MRETATEIQEKLQDVDKLVKNGFENLVGK